MKKRKKEQPEYNRELQATFLEVVETQLRENEPPETRQTFERLLAEGISEWDAKILIGSAIAIEVWNISRSMTTFNRERFIRHLSMLPDQSFIDE